MMNNKVMLKDDIIKRTQVPVLGEISHNEADVNIIVTKDSRSVIAEQFRALRTNLSFFLTPEISNVILLTSSMSGEGKSFTSLNLALVLALSGKKSGNDGA
ncbi:hypothetical protein ACFJIV_01235 [Mucilaginibacter sp. UC70_90]